MELRYLDPSDPALSHLKKPAAFYRITDTKTKNQFGCHGTAPQNYPVGFDVGYSTRYVPSSHRVTRYSTKNHFDWSVVCDWKGLLSVCSTQEKAQREIDWRTRKRRQNIRMVEIFTQRLRWAECQVNSNTKIKVLANSEYNEDVLFMRATELIQVFGLSGNINEEAERGAVNEWLALEWIPHDMCLRWTQF